MLTCDFADTICVYEDVGAFDISMYEAVAVKILKAKENILRVLPDQRLFERSELHDESP